jgi:hypothetical protein
LYTKTKLKTPAMPFLASLAPVSSDILLSSLLILKGTGNCSITYMLICWHISVYTPERGDKNITIDLKCNQLINIYN